MAFQKSLFLVLVITTVAMGQMEYPSVTRFRQYLRINSSHPTPDYDGCIAWLRNQAEEIGLDFNLEYYEPPHSFAVWMTWNGSNPNLKSILHDSHMDVVAVDRSKWNHDPFSAFKDANGTIWARGAIDMKPTTVAVLESIRSLKSAGFQPLRTLHVLVLPDEELYSRGVKGFVNSTTFTNMNIGFALDEVTTAPGDEMLITYAEKSVWQFNYTVYGKAAHASLLPDPQTTAGQKLMTVIDRLMEFRASQYEQLQEPGITLQNLTSMNLVKVGGGVGNNILPHELWASFDMRIRTREGWNFTDVEEMLNNIAAEAGNDTEINFLVKTMDKDETATDDSNIWWVTLQNTCRELNITCQPYVPNGVTDGRYIRAKGVPVFGLNPFTNTPSTAHQDNESIHETAFVLGIYRFAAFFRNILTVPETLHP